MASDPQTWADLKTAVASWLVRDDQTDLIPQYIAFAERRLNRTVFSPERELTTDLTASASVALPADFWGVRTVWLDTDPKTVIDQMSLGVLRGTYAAATTGRPGNYAISGSNMILGPSPDDDYTIKLDYWQTIPALGASQASNWLLLAHPDLYLAAALSEAFLLLRDSEAYAVWEQKTRDRIEDVNVTGRRKRYSGTPFRIRSPVVV